MLLCSFAWPGTHRVDVPASASQVSGIKGVYHHAPLHVMFLLSLYLCVGTGAWKCLDKSGMIGGFQDGSAALVGDNEQRGHALMMASQGDVLLPGEWQREGLKERGSTFLLWELTTVLLGKSFSIEFSPNSIIST